MFCFMSGFLIFFLFFFFQRATFMYWRPARFYPLFLIDQLQSKSRLFRQPRLSLYRHPLVGRSSSPLNWAPHQDELQPGGHSEDERLLKDS